MGNLLVAEKRFVLVTRLSFFGMGIRDQATSAARFIALELHWPQRKSRHEALSVRTDESSLAALWFRSSWVEDTGRLLK
ncbi:MAG: hypothetical protein DWQ31_09110 [Planctomycetota bacterium]|nr:MAG: hypothetical protein DWQ31_09110 [Planctomycetota bacterium]REJ91389.1 MAG: hypothetical protein DWQ35_14655 [Planctomycetota bacterium]REK18491.1 MAG: hypothetical protein DWQ42_20030 [Planctomycetota bacterium]REK39449.1 MAG: hypothetical protein DWQ46_19475 [Planctomycetota bacterium]